jgi:hypothetical protein
MTRTSRALAALSAALLWLALVAPASAATQEYKGTAKGKSTKSYTVEVAADQTLKVELKAKSSAIHFNVTPPPATLGANPEAIFAGQTGGRTFAQKLEKPGRYRIDVFLEADEAQGGGQASFTLTVSTEP